MAVKERSPKLHTYFYSFLVLGDRIHIDNSRLERAVRKVWESSPHDFEEVLPEELRKLRMDAICGGIASPYVGHAEHTIMIPKYEAQKVAKEAKEQVGWLEDYVKKVIEVY